MNPFNVKDNTTIDTGKLEKIFLEEGICKKLKKNDYLIRQNEKNSQIGFVSSGIFRLSHIDGNANEWIVGYSFKDDFVCDYPSLMSKTNSTVNIQASTACEVYLLTSDRLNQFWETDMDTQRLGRQIAENMFAEIYRRYQTLMKRCPDLQKHLSLKEIAQFLGITSETLSRIRRKQLFK